MLVYVIRKILVPEYMLSNGDFAYINYISKESLIALKWFKSIEDADIEVDKDVDLYCFAAFDTETGKLIQDNIYTSDDLNESIKLNEMAFTSNQIKQKYIEQCDSICTHLLICIILKDIGKIDHWAKEMDTILNRLNQMVWVRHGKQKVSDIDDNLINNFININNPYDDFDDCFEIVKNKEPQFITDTYKENKDEIVDLYVKLAKNILEAFKQTLVKQNFDYVKLIKETLGINE